MCGIVGYITENALSDITILDKMVETLNHRGPDDKGARIYSCSSKKIGFGQTRLAILDLSKAGHQPMEYKNFSIVYNGEIYNYKEIKSELKKLSHKFISDSDTEVILHAFEEWGTNAVHKFIGMFAFSILDTSEKKLYLFRDRAGVKPVYFYSKKGLFLFASELKSLHKHPAFVKKIDHGAVKLFFDHGYIPAPYSIFCNTYKLLPGNFLVFNLAEDSYDIKEYWNIEHYYLKPKQNISYIKSKQRLNELFISAFKYRMISDVPVGVFLSGGYDSTAVAAILQNEFSSKVKTFTIGFDEGKNEAPYAKSVANFLGTDHTEFMFSSKDAQSIIPQLPYFYDEPFFDSSSIPTTMVSKLAKKEVTVALSADGGDEIFAGYPSYPSLRKRLSLLNKIPTFLKPLFATSLSFGANTILKKNEKLAHRTIGVSKSLNSHKIRQARNLFYHIHTIPESYHKKLFISDAQIHKSGFKEICLDYKDEIEMALATDFSIYLPNDILTKVDRATMSQSLEGREPFLDHRIVEFAAQLPLDYKFDGVTTKKILKDIVHDYVPKKLMDRPKSGFSIPLYSWLRGDLSYLLEKYLSKKALKHTGIFNVEFVVDITNRFKRKDFYYVTLIWKLIVFQMWYYQWID